MIFYSDQTDVIFHSFMLVTVHSCQLKTYFRIDIQLFINFFLGLLKWGTMKVN